MIKSVDTKPPVQINEDVIRVLTEALEEARRCEITDVAVCYVRPSGVAGDNFSHGRNRAVALIGAATILCRDLLNETVTVPVSEE